MTAEVKGEGKLVVLLSEQYHPKVGGPTYFLDGIAKGLLELGFRVKLIVPGASRGVGNSRREMAECHNQPSYEVIRVCAEGDVWGQWKRSERRRFVDRVGELLTVNLKEWQPWAIHVVYGHYLYRAIRRVSDCPTVWTIYNLPPAESQSWIIGGDGIRSTVRRGWRRVYGLMSGTVNRFRVRLANYDCLVATSGHVVSKLRSLRPNGRIEVVGGGIRSDCCALSELGKEAKPRRQSSGKLRLITVAGIVPHKGPHIAVEAARLLGLKEMLESWRFIGPVRDSQYKQWVERTVSRYGLGELIQFVGPLEQKGLCSEYSQADICVQPSLEEGFCLAALEALAHGTPVVGTPVGAIAELVQVGGGRIVPRDDPNALARALEEHLATDWSSESRRLLAHRIRERFSWRLVASQLARIYEQYH